MVESIYFLKPAWCGETFAGLWPEQGLQPVTRATALRRWFVTVRNPATGSDFERAKLLAGTIEGAQLQHYRHRSSKADREEMLQVIEVGLPPRLRTASMALFRGGQLLGKVPGAESSDAELALLAIPLRTSPPEQTRLVAFYFDYILPFSNW